MLVSLFSTCEVTSFATQRRLMENADERFTQPDPGGRFETGCVVRARRRRFWREQLKMLILFQDPTGESAVEAIPPGVERYSRRWPHIPVTELRASAVEHPYCKGEHLLLHKRRTPMDLKDPCLVCA